jgi:hypothetical protein
VSSSQAAPEAEPSFEHKFLFARCHRAVVEGLLNSYLNSDPGFGAGRISSIYYDTPALDLYHEKRASTYLKDKIRVRWYGDPAASTSPDVPCWLELKSKVGGTRQKKRLPLSLPSEVLTKKDLTSPILRAIPEKLPTYGHSFDGAIVPMLVVQYERRRFVEPRSGTRVAIDTDICCPAVNRHFVPAFPPAFLDMCVLELKGPERELPHWLRPMGDYIRRDAFSKYASCFEHLLQPAGRRE